MTDSIVSHATVLTNRPSLRALLRRTGPYVGKELRQRLEGRLFTPYQELAWDIIFKAGGDIYTSVLAAEET